MDAHLDTLSDELCSEHLCWLYRTTTGCHGWFHCCFGSDDADADDSVSSPSDDEMST